MKKILLGLLLILSLSSNIQAQSTLSFGFAQDSFTASSSGATTAGTAYALPGNPAAVVTWQTIYSSTPTAITVLLQGSMDNSTYNTIDTSTSTAGEIRTVITAIKFIRAQITAKTGTFNTTVTLIAKAQPTSNASLFNGGIISGDITTSANILQNGTETSGGATAKFSTVGKVGIGTTNPLRSLHISDGNGSPLSAMSPNGVQVMMSGTTTSGSIIGVVANNVTAHFPGLYLRSVRARGTFAIPTIVNAGDLITFLEAEAFNGTSRCPIANIGLFANTVTTTNISGYINFLTATEASGCGPAERFRVDENGVSANQAYRLNTVLTISVTAPTIASGGCTTPAVTWNNGTASFLVTIGTSCTGVKSFTLTMPAAAHFWSVSCDNNTSDAAQATNYVIGRATSTTAVVLTSYDRVTGLTEDFTASDTYLCKSIGG
jgi:hypothetical protein